MSEAVERQRHTKHVYRVLIILGVMAVVVLAVRYILIPEGWGEHGNFRTGAVADMLAIEPVHGRWDGCKKCHPEQWETVRTSHHATLSCESCHEPLSFHVENDRRKAQMPTDRSYKLCARCHRRIQGRPEGFPQVKIDAHLEEMGGEFGPEVCLDCHASHAPLEGLR